MNTMKLILRTRPLSSLLGSALALTGLALVAATVGAAEVGQRAIFRRGDAPDIIFYNGKITTVDANDSTDEAIAIRDGKVIALGRSGPVRALATKSTKAINLNGRRVLPGLIDGHLHGMRNAYHCFTQTVRLDLITSRTKGPSRLCRPNRLRRRGVHRPGPALKSD